MSATSREKAPRLVYWAQVASYALAIILATCLAITAILVVGRFVPTWDRRGLPVVCALAASEAVFSYWLLKHSMTAQRQTIYYRLTEWGILLVLLKLFTELRHGPQALLDNVLHWAVDFPANVITGEYFLNLFLMYLAWQVSTLFATDLYLLEVDEAIRVDERLAKSPLRNLILRRFLNIGIVVIILVGLLFEKTLLPGEPAPHRFIVPALLYFLFGLVLVSLTRYASLDASWRQAQAGVSRQVPGYWALYTGVILGFLTILAILLPVNYGMGLLPTMQALFHLVGLAIGYIYAFILFIVTQMASLYARLLGKNEAPPLEEEATPQMPEFMPPPVEGTSLWEIVRSVLFWGVVGILLFLVLRQYLIFNQDFANELKKFHPLRWLAAFWRRLRESFGRTNQNIGEMIRRGIQRLRGSRAGSAEMSEWDYLNLRRLNPRQKILFYYLALIKRAGEAGIPRRQEQTPYEYAHSLMAYLGEERAEIETITESFVEARYSNHSISREKANRAASLWEMLRNILRRGRRPPS